MTARQTDRRTYIRQSPDMVPKNKIIIPDSIGVMKRGQLKNR